MPNVRKTPKRPRTACPECGRDVAYSVNRPRDPVSGGYFADGSTQVPRHNRPDGGRCSLSGTTFQIPVPEARRRRPL